MGAKSSKVQYGPPGYSPAGQMVLGELRAPLGSAIQSDIITNPYTNQASNEYKSAVSAIRGGYGARGLANSGIAIQGEQQALSDIAAKTQAQRAQQLTGILATGSSSPSFPSGTSPQARGFMGLK